MSFQGKRELLAQVSPRYREANRTQKTIILNEFIASTGYARKYAIGLLTLPVIPPAAPIRKPRPRLYGKEIQEILRITWAAANYIASKRLAPFLVELVPALERHGHLQLTEEVRAQLLRISPATIDRLLQPLYAGSSPKGISTTKSGLLLKNQVPVRTFADWTENRPGFFEADLVAHCGWSIEGSFLYTLVLTDIATGWIECLPLLHRSKYAVVQALEQARGLLPFPVLGLDTDNGSEFLNGELIAYCQREEISFTRGRPYKKNDQCFVEQKNGAVVRQLVGYDRFEGEKAYRQLGELYRGVRLYVNFFQPSMKLQFKQREGSKVKRSYDTAQTPFQRLCAAFDDEKFERMRVIYEALDPVRLLQQIVTLQNALWKHAVLRNADNLAENVPNERMTELQFKVSACGLFEEDSANNVDKVLLPSPTESRKRKYRKEKQLRSPRHWRTRKDPFADVWDEVCQWLKVNPERTAKSLFLDLEQRFPGKFPKNQFRTFQRRVQAWRANAILTFNDKWLEEDVIAQTALPLPLGAVLEATNLPL